MEIRDYLGVKKNEKILVRFSAAENEFVLLNIAKAPSDYIMIACSRNGAYVKKKERVF